MRALVLEGGGAKGAYQLGVLLALRQAGFQFDVIAGSSVGALNGYLYATDELALGLSFWWNIKCTEVLGVRAAGPLVALFSPIYWFFHGYTKPYQSARPLDGLLINAFLFSIGILGDIGMLCYNLARHHAINWPEQREFLLFVLAMYAAFSMPYIFRIFRLSLFRPSRLEKLIRTVNARSPIKASLIVTLTEMVDSFDPDSPAVAAVRTARFVSTAPRAFPVYLDVSRPSCDEICNGLLGSSALPNGVFPSGRVKETDYVDGGVSDNLPAFGALGEDASISDLTVVRLRPSHSEDLQNSWQIADRLLRLRELQPNLAKQMREEWVVGHALLEEGADPDFFIKRIVPPDILPLRQRQHWPEPVVEIAPLEDLGDFISGTINFDREKARSLLNMGWADCHRSLGSPASIPSTLPFEELLSK